MNRYFFDFDDVPDRCGITMPSADAACVEALLSMPEYVSEVLERDGGVAKVTCSIRENDRSTSYKIVVAMHVEDESGAIIRSPFKLPGLGMPKN